MQRSIRETLLRQIPRNTMNDGRLTSIPRTAAIVCAWLVLSTSACEAADRWYLQPGQKNALCRDLLRIANANTSPSGSPTVPWVNVFAIPGVSEPRWKSIDPELQTLLFTKARLFMQNHAEVQSGRKDLSLLNWVQATDNFLSEAAVDERSVSDEDARAAYQTFAKAGGAVRVLPYDAGDETGPVPKVLVQYERIPRISGSWDGYSLRADAGMSGFSEPGYPHTSLGRGYRILIYRGKPFSFFGQDVPGAGEYRVDQLSGNKSSGNARYFCKININAQGRQK